MLAFAQTGFILALFGLGGGEIVLILSLVLILFGAKKIPDMARGLGRGLLSFREAMDESAREAGRSTSGIYGKAAAQALTPDNRVAELYDPAVLRDKRQSRRLSLKIRILVFVRRLLRGVRSMRKLPRSGAGG